MTCNARYATFAWRSNPSPEQQPQLHVKVYPRGVWRHSAKPSKHFLPDVVPVLRKHSIFVDFLVYEINHTENITTHAPRTPFFDDFTKPDLLCCVLGVAVFSVLFLMTCYVWCSGVGGGSAGVQVPPKSFDLSKILAKSLKIQAKMAPNVCIKTHENLFWRSHQKKSSWSLWEKICRQKSHKNFSGKFG